MAVRLHGPVRPGAGVLLALSDSSGRAAVSLQVQRDGSEDKIAFVVFTDYSPQPLSVGLPLRLLSKDPEQTLLLRYQGYRLDLFVNGVLADQEWPMGTIAPGGIGRLSAAAPVREIETWSRVLDDQEVSSMAGGLTAVEARTQAMFGPEQEQAQSWRPRGYNTNAGDAMPFFKDGTFHVFFLLDRRHHGSKWGLGAHQWGHIWSTDLVHWHHEAPALAIDHEWEASICTGSVFYRKGKYYAFYATRMPDRSERLGLAESEDGVSFQKQLPTPFDDPQLPYRRGPNRDPFVFEDQGTYHMLVTASLLQPENPGQAGALEHLVSTDLEHWKALTEPFLVPGYAADPECPDLFAWKGWYYLFFGVNGVTHYRMARDWAGPWTTPPNDTLDAQGAHVMKVAEFTGDRRIGVAFLPMGGWGGSLVFRELHQSADGKLALTFPPEMPAVSPGR